MGGHTCLDRLANGRYENHDGFCNVCHVYKHNGSKRRDCTVICLKIYLFLLTFSIIS